MRGVNTKMNAKLLLFVFLLLIANHLNAATHKFLIVEKDLLQVKKIVKRYLLTNGYKIKESDNKILEIYFDTPELLYLKQNGFIRFKALEYLTKKKKRVKYHKTVEYSYDNNTSFVYPVKHYNSVKSFEEKHQLLSLVKRKEREGFLNKLKSDGLKYPMRLKEIVKISKIKHSFEHNMTSTNVGKIAISQMRVSALESEIEFIMLEIVTKNQAIVDDLKEIVGTKDANIKDTEYALVFEQMKKNVDLFYWILRYPYLVNLLYALGFGALGLLIIFALFSSFFRNTKK